MSKSMYQNTYSAAELKALRQRGARYLVVCCEHFGDQLRGDVISWHKSRDAAQRAAEKNLYVGVYDLSDKRWVPFHRIRDQAQHAKSAQR